MITPTTSDFDNSIREFLGTGSGLDINQVIPGNDGGPVPDGLFASVLLVHQDIEGVPATEVSPADEVTKLNVGTVATVRDRYSVQWFRKGARDAARRLSLWVWSPEGIAKAHESGLTVMRVSDVRQLDDVVSGAWEERAGVDIEVGYTQSIEQTVGRIESVPVEVTVGGRTETGTMEV